MTRGQLMRVIDARELLDWESLELHDPWGQRRDDLRFALLASTIANSAGATRKKDGKEFTVDDFDMRTMLPEYAPEEGEPLSSEQTPEKIEAMFKMVVAANNAFWSKQHKH